MHFLSASGVALDVPLCVDLEVSLLVDVGTSPGVPVPPADVGVDVNTWVVGVFPSTVQVYMQRMSVITTGARRQLHKVLTYIPVLTCFTAGCRLMLGPLTAHTFTL